MGHQHSFNRCLHSSWSYSAVEINLGIKNSPRDSNREGSFFYSTKASKDGGISGLNRGEPKPKPCINPLANSDVADGFADNEINGDDVTDGETYCFMIIYLLSMDYAKTGSSLFALMNDNERSKTESNAFETAFAATTPATTPRIAGTAKLLSSIESLVILGVVYRFNDLAPFL